MSREAVNEDEIFILDKDIEPNNMSLPDPEPEPGGRRNRPHLDLTQSLEHAPPEMEDVVPKKAELIELIPSSGDIKDYEMGRKLYFEDGTRRIDYILSWSTKEKKESDRAHNEKARKIFEQNLINEGLELEYDFKPERELQYVKIHATWEVLTRYAEVMKVRMPMQEVPEDIASNNFFELMSDAFHRLLSPFQLDPEKVPPMPKKFTCVFERNKEYLFAIPEQREIFFSHAIRSRIVDYILRRKRYSDHPKETFSFGITRLISKNVYLAAYPLHEGSWKPWTKPSMRRLLFEHWAHWKNFYKVQPLDHIRTYFGEKIGMYFAWLGFYTWMLLPASLVGLIVFIYGVATINENIIAQETCAENKNFTMCPACDIRCPYYFINISCNNVRASHMFDNGATVFFAIFMSLWGTVFLEFWKREQAAIKFQWNLLNFEAEEEPPRPEYLVKLGKTAHKKKNRITGVLEPFLPFWRRRVPVYVASFSCMLFMVFLAIVMVVGVIVYRMSAAYTLRQRNDEIFFKHASMVSTATAACINLIIIVILNYIYAWIAEKLTDWECLRTQSEFDNSLTIKLYSLQFVNYYSSIFYIAFFKGRFSGRPGHYSRFMGARQEECSAGGCLIELAIQLAVIFIGKQLIQNNLMEILLPRLKILLKKCFSSEEEKSTKNKQPWEKDYYLEPIGPQGLFNEYLEMLLQFGFVTIFVAAFPLAPLFALLNNVIEIRADANKFVTQLRRPMAMRAEDIGVWYQVLYAVGRLAVLTNAMIIAFTSGFIHRLVYTNSYSKDGTLAGYVDNSLAYFNVSHFANGSQYYDPEGLWGNVTLCRYLDYREPPWSDKSYEYTAEYWHIMAAQFMFIFAFENVVVFTTSVIAFLIPDMPRKLKEQVRREAYLTNEIIIKTELEIARGLDGILAEDELLRIRQAARDLMLKAVNDSEHKKKEDVENGDPDKLEIDEKLAPLAENESAI